MLAGMRETVHTPVKPSVLRKAATALVVSAALALGAFGAAHQTIEVGDGAYRVVVGLLAAPLYAGEIEGIDLGVFDANDEPVENLAGSLDATIISPTGGELALTLRPQSDRPGYYTADFIPTVAGNYQVRIAGFIGDVGFDVLFDAISHADPAVIDPATIEVP